MKSLTACCVLSFAVAASMMASSRRSLRFTELSDLLLNQDELYKKVSLCPHSQKVETDGRGHSWPRFCFVSRDGEETEVLFQREYTGGQWTYHLDQFIGMPEFQFRVVERIRPCPSDQTETDGQGLAWPLWCHADGSPVFFERLTPEQGWTYLVDTKGGVKECEYRRIQREKTSFEETEWTFFWDVFGLSDRDDIDDFPTESDFDDSVCPESAAPTVSTPSISQPPAPTPAMPIPFESDSSVLEQDCYPLETDNSGRYFWLHTDLSNLPISYQRDSRGNFLISNSTHTRIPENTSIPADLVEHDIALACDIAGNDGNPLEFEADSDISGVYWADDHKSYELAVTDEELTYGMYRLDDETGKRIETVGF